jgi:hypothetical protein
LKSPLPFFARIKRVMGAPMQKGFLTELLNAVCTGHSELKSVRQQWANSGETKHAKPAARCRRKTAPHEGPWRKGNRILIPSVTLLRYITDITRKLRR